MKVTKHAASRIKTRVGVSKKNAHKNAQKAMQYGLLHKETKGDLKRYCSRLWCSQERANNMRIYHGNIYLFNGLTLITVVHVPHQLVTVANKLEQEKYERLMQNWLFLNPETDKIIGCCQGEKEKAIVHAQNPDAKFMLCDKKCNTPDCPRYSRKEGDHP